MENQVEDKLLTLQGELKAYFEKAGEEVKSLGTQTTETKTGLDALTAQHTNLQTQIEAVRAEMLRPRPIGTKEFKSVGEQFVESQHLIDWCRSMGTAFKRSSWSMEIDQSVLQACINARLADQAMREWKTTITSAAVGREDPGILQYERLPGIFIPPPRRVRMRDLIPFRPTQMGAIEYVKRNVFTNTASPVGETVSKAESTITYTIDSAIVRTIAHWIPAARQVLEDLPGLRAAIDFDLMNGLADAEDDQIISGDGSGNNIYGILPQATPFAGTYSQTGDTRIDKLNRALAEVEDHNYLPDAIVINPADYRIIQSIKENSPSAGLGIYVAGGPAGPAPKSLWDVPIAKIPAFPVGYFLVGQFAGVAQGFDRMTAVIDVSTEHADFFIRNMVAIRCEERATMIVKDANAFVSGTF